MNIGVCASEDKQNSDNVNEKKYGCEQELRVRMNGKLIRYAKV